MTLTHHSSDTAFTAADQGSNLRGADSAPGPFEAREDAARGDAMVPLGGVGRERRWVDIEVLSGLGWPLGRPTRGPLAAGAAEASVRSTGRSTGLGWPVRAVSRETPSPTVELHEEHSHDVSDALTTSPVDARHDSPTREDSAEAPAVDPLRKSEARQGESLPRPDRTRVMVVANQKGGVGKTTSTVNLAAALAQGGLRVLVIDLDPQGNASTALAIEHHRGLSSIYDALVDGVPLVDVVSPSPQIDGLFVVPATIDLAGAEIELVSMVAREGRLRRAVHAHPLVFGPGEDRFDYVLIDCPPSLGLLTLNALVAADEMMIPIQAEYYALEGLGQLLETVDMVREHLNPGLAVSTIVLTMYDARTRLAAGVADEVRTHFPRQVLRTAIPRSVRISEAPSYGQTVITYDPGSPGALSYLEAAREVALAVLHRVPTEEPRSGEVRA